MLFHSSSTISFKEENHWAVEGIEANASEGEPMAIRKSLLQILYST
jgi:hypothetical protein